METPVNAPLKEKFHLEIAKLRSMSFKEKLEYIWEYYKLHIIAFCIIAAIMGSLLNTWVFNPPPETALFISWNSGLLLENHMTDLSEAMEERLLNENENKKVVVTWMFVDINDPTSVMTSINQLAAMVSARMVDVFLVNSATLLEYAEIGYIKPIEAVLAEIQYSNPSVYARIKEEIIYALLETEENQFSEHILGVNIGNSPLFSDLGFFKQELYFTMSITSDNPEAVTEALIAFFE